MADQSAESPERSYAGMTRAERDAQRRRRLLDSALELFGTAGYPASSVDEICSNAGVSTRNFYQYFAGREGILLELYDELVDGARTAVAQAFGALAADASPRDWSRAGLTAFSGYMLGDERRGRVNFVEVVGATPAVEAHRRAALRSFASLLREVMTQLVAAGHVAPRPPVEVEVGTTALVGAVQETLTDWLASEQRRPLDQVVDGLVEFFALVVGDVKRAEP